MDKKNPQGSSTSDRSKTPLAIFSSSTFPEGPRFRRPPFSNLLLLDLPPPVEKVREQYTEKFVYEDADGKQAGHGLDMYTSLEGYRYGIAAVISNMANVAAHGGKASHDPESDHFSVTLKCNDPACGLFYLNLSRERLTISSYSDDALLDRVRDWADRIPALEGVTTPPPGRRKRGRPPRSSIRDSGA